MSVWFSTGVQTVTQAMIKFIRKLLKPKDGFIKKLLKPKELQSNSSKRVYNLAASYLGLTEVSGVEHNAEIVQFFADVGHGWVKDDETAWCAAFAGSCLKKAGIPHTGKLNARSYLTWGEAVRPEEAVQGDILVFWRVDPNSWQGHVGFFHGKDSDGNYLVLGGNQGNQVSIKTYHKSRLLAVRRWKE